MRTLASVVFQLALSLWIGAVVAVSFLVAPVVFSTLPNQTAGNVMGHIFSLYYGFTVATGVVALAAAAWLWRRGVGGPPLRMILPMLVLMLAATSYAGGVVSPRARELRTELHREPVDPAVRAEFDGLHRRAVQLNGLVLVLGLCSVVVTARAVRWPGER